MLIPKSITLLVLITFINLVIAKTDDDGGLEVEVKQGRLRGKFWKSKEGRDFKAFIGIPYAKPPVKELRFKAPIPIDPWQGVKNATEVHAVCPQRDIYRRATVIEGDEDCLYLNVYTPKLSAAPLLPVLIFLHGGGWLCGGGNSHWYGPDFLLDQDVVLVVPNYRLGPLGFLSMGDTLAPGNNGLKDQNLALKWVAENIRKFGGDPESITMIGESAGGASVQLHMASPLSKDLFHRGISQSGTAHCTWGLDSAGLGVRNSKKLARAFGCSTACTEKMLECLRKIDAYSIIEKDRIYMDWDTDPMIPFRPVIEPKHEGAFLSEHPIDAMKAGRMARMPWITGINSEDGALRAAGIYGNPELIDELNENFDKFIHISLIYDESEYMTSKIKTFYLDDKKIDESTRQAVVDMYTDAWFLNGADEAVRFYKKYSKQPIYYYLFTHRGANSFTEIFGDPHSNYGVCHADELQYLFPLWGTLFQREAPTDDDHKIAKLMTTMWANFAKTGNPTPDDEVSDLVASKWSPVKSDDDMEYYLIGTNTSEMRKGLYADRAKFWRRLPFHPRQNDIKDEL